jgi:hypothetical protein
MPEIKQPFRIIVVQTKTPAEAGGVSDRRHRIPALATDTSGGSDGTGRHLLVVRRRRMGNARRAEAAEKRRIAQARHKQLATGILGPYPKPTEFVRKPLIEDVLSRCPIGC